MCKLKICTSDKFPTSDDRSENEKYFNSIKVKGQITPILWRMI